METNIQLYSFDEIQKGVSSVGDKIAKNEVNEQNKNEIKKCIKKIKAFLIKWKLGNGIIALSNQIGANCTYAKLLLLLKQDKIDYNHLIAFAEPSDQIKLFIEHCDSFTDEEYWEKLANAYTLQNYKKIPYKVYHELFSAKRPYREKMMDDEELNLFKKLPGQLTIYRGGSKTEEKTKKYGISWTLDKTIAENFAHVKSIRDKKDMVVIEKTISKKEVVAYFISRKEEEIIYLG